MVLITPSYILYRRSHRISPHLFNVPFDSPSSTPYTPLYPTPPYSYTPIGELILQCIVWEPFNSPGGRRGGELVLLCFNSSLHGWRIGVPAPPTYVGGGG